MKLLFKIKKSGYSEKYLCVSGFIMSELFLLTHIMNLVNQIF